MSKGDPIPAKFDPPEENLIRELASKTGLTVSEVIRRAVRLLRLEITKRGDDWHAFLIRDLGPDWTPPAGTAARQEDDTALTPYGDKKIVSLPEKRATRKVSYSGVAPKKQARK